MDIEAIPRTVYLRGKAFFLTYPQCAVEPKEAFTLLNTLFPSKLNRNITKYVIAKELHEDGNPHLHCFIGLSAELRQSVDARSLDLLGNHPNIQVVRSAKDVVKYCTKECNYVTNMEANILRWRNEVARDKSKLARELMDGKKLPELTEANPFLLFGYARLKMDLQMFLVDKADVKDLDGVCGVWIWGPAGAGKSTIATTRMGEYYPKGKNKWWDGYNGQPTVVCEDVDFSWKEIYTYFKYWADRFKFLAECKGGTMLIRPRKLVVTSNKSLEELLEIWGLQQHEYGPYTRRFNQYFITTIDDWDEQL